MVEELRKSLSERKPATLWNTLELLRRIINFGVKTNRCPNLAFQDRNALLRTMRLLSI